MALSTTELSVTIEGKNYSILSEPSDKSDIVLREKENIISALDLKNLVEDLGRVGQFIRIAYNAIVAGGAGNIELTKIQIQVYHLGIDITKLCDKSATTVKRFSTASHSIIMTLKSSYQNLLDGLEDMAMDDLTSMSFLAKQMSEAASALQKEFDQQQVKVVEAIDQTSITRANEEKELGIKEKMKLELTKKSEEAELKMKDTAEIEARAREAKTKYSLKEDEALGRSKSILKRVVDFLPGHVIVKTLADKVLGEDPEEEAARWRQKSREKDMEEQKARDDRYDSLSKLNQFLVEMECIKEDQSQTEMAIRFLLEATGALKKLSDTMQKAAQFWSDLSIYCDDLSKNQITKTIQAGMKRDTEEARRKVWISESFKIKAVTYYGKWVALHCMCNEYMEVIQETRSDLHANIVENMDHDEARQCLPDLVKNFKSNLEKEQKAILNRKREMNGTP